jgi:flavodoxin
MHALIVYESMYGNTHSIAEAIARGLGSGNDVTVVPVGGATRELLDGSDLIVVGGPTHVHGMSHARTRQAAVEEARKDGSHLTLDPDAQGPGLRDWFGSLGRMSARATAFDTRLAAPVMFTGRASKGIAALLRQHGLTLLAPAESFLVTKDNELRPGEEDRAEDWGRELAAMLAPARVQS